MLLDHADQAVRRVADREQAVADLERARQNGGFVALGCLLASQQASAAFIFDPATRQLTGRHTRRVIRLGDNVVVQIYKVDTIKKQVDFMPVPQRGKPTRSNDSERQDRRGPSSRDPKRPSAPPRKPGHGHKRAQQKKKKR